MQNLSLYNLLVGFFVYEGPTAADIERMDFAKLSEEQKIRRSIIENLTMILGTRQGSVSHLPDFGLPDIMQVYINSGYSFEPLKKQVRDTVLKYEPRIGNVRVEDPYFDKNNMRLFLKVVTMVKEFAQTETLLTEFSTTGWAKVVWEKDGS
jgi:type VI secretion system protein